MRKVLIPTKLDKFAADLLRDKGYNVVLDAATPIEDLVRANADAEVLIVRSEKVTPELIDLLPKLKLIVRAGAGYNTIDTKYARKKGVDVMNTPGANSNAVAEEVVAMMLAVSRHVVAADASTRAGEWEKSKFMGRELAGKTVGVLGLGNIGQLLVKRLAGFEMKVLGFDPVISPVLAEKLGVKLVTLEEVFAKADFISLHIPENEETRGMINRRFFDLMKPNAVLINCARCGVVNEDDLRAVKAEKAIKFCNDVYPKDAPGPKSCADIADLMLPHLGANTFEANLVAAQRSAEQTIAYFERGITNCVVNKSLPDGLSEKFQQLAYVLTALSRACLGKDANPGRIETSYYGSLAQFNQYMLSPIAAALADEFAPDQAPSDAEKLFAERGIEVSNREVDNDKHYGESMTIDLFAAASGSIYKSSARGTVTENQLMITRLNTFDRLFLEPSGHHLFVEYQDEPGIIGRIAGLLGEKNINIIDIRAPQNVNTGRALTVVQTNIPVPEVLVAKIKEAVKASNAFTFTYQA